MVAEGKRLIVLFLRFGRPDCSINTRPVENVAIACLSAIAWREAEAALVFVPTGPIFRRETFSSTSYTLV